MSRGISNPRSIPVAVVLACLVLLTLPIATAAEEDGKRQIDTDTGPVTAKPVMGPGAIGVEIVGKQQDPGTKKAGGQSGGSQEGKPGSSEDGGQKAGTPAGSGSSSPASKVPAKPAPPPPTPRPTPPPATPRPEPTPAPAAPDDAPAAAPPRQGWIPDPAAGQPKPGTGSSAPTLIPDGGGDRIGSFPPPPDPVAQRQAPPPPGEQRPSGGGGGTDPREVAIDILVTVPLPDIRIRANPALGLVALPSWYWVDGYAGQSFGASRTIDIPPEVSAQVPVDLVPADDPRRQGRSFTVEVRVWGSRYDWDFGDGATAAGTLGRAYPAESDVQHTYRHSSLPFPGGFPVRLTVEYAAEYWVDGAGPFGLPSVRRTYETAHRVQEIQTVLVAR